MAAKAQDSGPRGPFTEDVRKMLIALISNGSSRRMAARYVGVHPASLSRLMAREPQFCEEVLRAEGNVEIEALRRIREAGKDPRYWRANAWLLERLSPIDFAQRPAESLSYSEVQGLLTHYCDRVAAILPRERRAEVNRLVELIAISLQEGRPNEFLTKHWKYKAAWRPWESEEYENAYAAERFIAAERAEAEMCNPAQAEPPAGPPETNADAEFAPGGRLGPPKTARPHSQPGASQSRPGVSPPESRTPSPEARPKAGPQVSPPEPRTPSPEPPNKDGGGERAQHQARN